MATTSLSKPRSAKLSVFWKHLHLRIWCIFAARCFIFGAFSKCCACVVELTKRNLRRRMTFLIWYLSYLLQVLCHSVKLNFILLPSYFSCWSEVAKQPHPHWSMVSKTDRALTRSQEMNGANTQTCQRFPYRRFL